MLKRSLDFLIAFFTILILLPIILIVALIIRLKLGSPVLFSQSRPGLNGKIFKIYKFRSMTSECDKNGVLLPDVERLTRFGKLLRSTSLDELPGLWNVLNGDMSLVGPRPLLPEYIPFYTKEEMQRHDVKPGITGLAQISGRNAITWEQKFALDLEYINKKSLFFDMKILLLTVKKVFKRDDILVSAPQGAFHLYRKKQQEQGFNE
ncbi:sugar transferase [Pseudoalteromonas sp. SG44-5]|uniref:sugar transferase n=1 Tax=Pseudoalteromonas sp. SG44-5 TaxID=2760960 RepID=UPI0015FCACF6|nr:sugar transferase [Pseudoalteromonas sp. SG44-5]MBB1406079.1 sugar transferase [Pseudoalteromonas sp. SG44-5]